MFIDDIPIQAIGLEAYRAQLGCVLQEDRLFAGSLAENIAGFSPSLDSERIQQVAKLAAIHEEILRMPMGYETLVGDMGSSLSGGQMQRVVLARALYRGPRILLLDEATSHLDEENERAINDALRRLTISRVIVAHGAPRRYGGPDRRSGPPSRRRSAPAEVSRPLPWGRIGGGRIRQQIWPRPATIIEGR